MAETLQISAMEKNSFPYTNNSKEYFDVIHINTIGIKSYLLVRKYKKSGKRVVLTAHTTEEDSQNSFWFTYLKPWNRVFRWWLIKLYNNADLLIAPTSYVKEMLQGSNYNISIPIKVISNGVDTEVFKPLNNKEEIKQEMINYLNERIS